MLAGGIGITPFLSMLGQLAAESDADSTGGRPIHLVWGVRTPDELFALPRLREYLARLPALHIQLFFSRATTGADVQDIDGIPPEVARSTGRISTDALTQQGLVGTGREFFLCGPRSLMETLIDGLRSHGVPGSNIHFEAFAM